MKEKVLETLKSLGFETKDFEIGYGFEFEGSHFLYLPSDDEHFLSIALPSVSEFDEENELDGYVLMNKVNREMKYVKTARVGDDIWLFYERNLLDDEDLKDVLERMIFSLEAAHFFMQDWEDKSKEDDDSDENEELEEDEDFDEDEESDEDEELEEDEDFDEDEYPDEDEELEENEESEEAEDISEEEDSETSDYEDLETEFQELLNKFLEERSKNEDTDSKNDNSDGDVA
jgi:hypothetical protein